MEKKDLVERIRQLMTDEGMTSTADYGTMTAQYIYKMWGGEVPLKEIETAMAEIQ